MEFPFHSSGRRELLHIMDVYYFRCGKHSDQVTCVEVRTFVGVNSDDKGEKHSGHPVRRSSDDAISLRFAH